MRDRAVDLAIAATLALLPLLPAGPTYFGRHWPWALEATFLVAAAIALLLLTSKPPDTAHNGLRQVVARGYLTWLIPIVAAMAIGLLERNPFDAVLLRIEADGLASRLAAPMNQAADPFYPLRVGLTALEGGLMFFLLSAILRRTTVLPRRVHAAVTGCLAGMTIVSAIAIVQYVTRGNLHEYWVRFNPDLTRSHATLDDPNALASYLVLGIGLATGIAWATESGRRRVFALCVTGLACAGIVTTVSRAGMAALAIAAVIVTAALPDALVATAHARTLRRAARAAAMAGAIALIGWGVAFAMLPKRATPVTPETPLDALIQTVDPRESAATILKRRHLLWGAGAHLVAMHWAAGAGLGQFPRFLASYPGADGPENAHNFFLQVLAEGGIVGFAGLIVLLGAIAAALREAARVDDSATRRFALGLSVGVLAFVLTWLTGHPLLTLSNQLWFATVLAVGLTAIDAGRGFSPGQGGGSHPGAPGEAGRRRAWIPIVVLVTLAVSAPRAIAAVDDGARVGHAAGVYGWEPAPPSDAWPTGTTFRWTRGHAAIREPVGGATLLLPIFLARPDIDAQPVVVDVKVAGVAVPSLTLTRNGWHVQTYDLVALLGEDRWRGQRAVTVEFVVRPTVVPARVGPSTDRRELGIGLGVVRWSLRAPQAAAGQGA
jgi:O-antigen ligase